jgi:hypothetical protein
MFQAGFGYEKNMASIWLSEVVMFRLEQGFYYINFMTSISNHDKVNYTKGKRNIIYILFPVYCIWSNIYFFCLSSPSFISTYVSCCHKILIEYMILILWEILYENAVGRSKPLVTLFLFSG